MSVFKDIPRPTPDVAFSLVAAYKEDTSAKKANLCPGFYRDEKAEPWVLPCVRKSEEIMNADPTINHEHLPLLGHPGLVAGGRKIAFGAANQETLSRIASIQTVSGTGSNHLGARFLSSVLRPKNVWLSDPTWVNHTEIWALDAPDAEQRLYPYYDCDNFTLDFDGMVSCLRYQAERGDVVVLHACAHNPTGLDPNPEQWREIASVCEERGLFALFDSAYQGFATGSLDDDAFAIRHFLERRMEFAVAQSFSKNFGLYGERVGALHVVASNEETAGKVEGRLIKMSRAEITSCPSYGARIIAAILNDENLYRQWLADLDTMSSRMKSMRQRLHDELVKRETPGLWGHLLTDVGMFSMTGLSKDQCGYLKDKYHVYLLPSGRLSVTGLTDDNVEYVAEAISQAKGIVWISGLF